MADQIKYKEGYIYQMVEDYSIDVSNVDIVGYEGESDFLTISKEGLLIIKKGYAWDGPSGPTFHTKNFMRGSLVHDALYQLMREEILPRSCQEPADHLLQQICQEDGMSDFRSGYVYEAVKNFGSANTDPKNKKKILTAP